MKILGKSENPEANLRSGGENKCHEKMYVTKYVTKSVTVRKL